MRYVEYNIWTGKIHQVSSIPILPTRSNTTVREFLDDPIIEEMSDDKRSLESGFIGMRDKAYTKEGTIHLIRKEKALTKIPLKIKDETPDVSLILYTNNKLLEININYKSLKTWYNHRMKDKFSFADPYIFYFTIKDLEGNIIKEIEVLVKNFLNNFQTIVDLSSIKNLEDISISTNKRFESYGLEVKRNKYFNLSNDENTFNKASTKSFDRKIHNIIISRTNIKNNILIEINNLDVSTISKSLDFYITGKEPNELHEILCIPIEKLWNKKTLIKKLQGDILNKSIWCNNKTISIFVNHKVISLRSE